jgi:WD40 repeat protein
MVTAQVEDVSDRFPQFLTTSLVIDRSGILGGFRPLTPIGLSYDGSVVYGISGSQGATGSRALVFHDVESGELISRIEPSPRVQNFLVDSAARTAVIETQDGAVSVWDVGTSAKLVDLLGPKHEEEKVDLNVNENIELEPAGNSLSITRKRTDENGEISEVSTTIYRLRPDAPQLVRAETDYRTGHMLDHGAEVVLGTASGLIESRSLDGQLLAQEQVHSGAVVGVEPAMGKILTAGWDGVVAALDPSSLAVITRVKAHDTPVSALSVAPDGTRIATGTYDGALALWPDGLDASPLLLSGHDSAVSQLLFTATSNGLVSADHEGRILLHDSATGETLREIVAAGPPIWDMVAVPGSNLIVASRGSGEVVAWDQPGTTIQRWTLDLGSRVRTLVADQAGRHLAFGLEDGRVLVLNDPAATSSRGLHELRSFDGQRSAVVGLTFVSSGTLLAGVSRDRTLRLWDVETGRQVAVWESSGSTPLALLADADGRNTVTLFDDNLIEFRRLPSAKLREVIADVSQTLVLFPPIPFALCDQLRVTVIPGAARVCAPPG